MEESSWSEVYVNCTAELYSTVGRDGIATPGRTAGTDLRLSFADPQLHGSVGDPQSFGYCAQIAIAGLNVSLKFLGREPAEQSQIGIFAHVFVDGVARNAKCASRSGRLKVVSGKSVGNSVVVDWIG